MRRFLRLRVLGDRSRLANVANMGERIRRNEEVVMNIKRWVVVFSLCAWSAFAGCKKEERVAAVPEDGRSGSGVASRSESAATSVPAVEPVERPSVVVPEVRVVTTHPSTQPTTQPDNTAKNKVDQGGRTKTPMDQSESVDDIQITADIRRAIMKDETMSMNAQNCKIVTDKAGMVTLRGVVDSEAEKVSIGVKAKAVAGETRVDNQLEVKTN